MAAKDFPGIVIAEEREWRDCIQGSTAVVNLAGLPISTRWSPEVSFFSKLLLLLPFYPALISFACFLQIKKEIKDSRVRVTSKVSTHYSFDCSSYWLVILIHNSFFFLLCGNFIKVVELINNSPLDARPTVLVSATAVGYYGLSPKFFHTLWNLIFANKSTNEI